MPESLDKLHLWEENPRDISKEDFEKLKKLIIGMPQLHKANPILALKNGEIFSGNQRYKALQELGIKEYPVEYYDCTRKEAIEMAIVMNTHAGTWLQQELFELANEFDIDLEQFNIDAEIQKAIDKLEPEVVEDTVPEIKKDPQTVLGDLWILGSHRLLAGDATKIDDVEKLMNGEKADMVYTDPPYGMNLDTNYDGMFKGNKWHNKKGDRFDAVIDDDKDYDPNPIFAIEANEYFIWGADYFYDKLPKGGSLSAWDKRNETMDAVIGNTTEFLWSKNPHRRMTARVLWSGHHGMGKGDEKSRIHPTQKPIALHKWFFDNYGNNVKSVVDIYGGSGSTLIACEQLGRKCYMMELDCSYVRVIIDRWEELTGKKAVLLS